MPRAGGGLGSLLAQARAWRRAIAAWCPENPGVERLGIAGPAFEARLLASWLGTRLSRPIRLERDDAAVLGVVTLDGEPVPPPRVADRGASELVSVDIEQAHRDHVFEEAACGLSSVTN